MPENRMRIAYIHDSPLFERLETDYRNPSKLLELGFTDVVLSDQMSGCLFGISPQLVDEIEVVSELGLGVWLMDDLFTLPAQSNAGCPGLEETWNLTSQAIQDVIESAPQIRGLVFRYGETFESSDSEIKRVGLFACVCVCA